MGRGTAAPRDEGGRESRIQWGLCKLPQGAGGTLPPPLLHLASLTPGAFLNTLPVCRTPGSHHCTIASSDNSAEPAAGQEPGYPGSLQGREA